ncbi:3-oxoacyl-[acyl-carrier protein] reductase [Ligilactobacillus sp. WC1T17]|uniref:3-oxoacyl-[acyl-carrier protein] reductase n=1 Tax=Ligilactobacillus ruminis TaxID=1623 RepID=A0ABY1A9W7_9LACO|nr:3-oxoacyl-[acyl-carrier protein] reductase [Ligilactobacillus ruminis]
MNWAIIFGASGDIGSQIARDLAQKGWSLYLHYHQNQKRVAALMSELSSTYPKQDFLTLSYDLTDDSQLDKLSGAIFGKLNAVVFAQGTTYYGLFADLDPQNLDTMVKMQVLTPLKIVQKLENKLAQAEFGRVVFIGSVYGGAGSAMEVGYSTVKGALSAFARAYAKEVASLGITVNVVAPGAVDTEMNQIFSADEKADVEAEIPVGRFSFPAEISYWVLCLLEPRSSYLTGQTLYATGGWLK